MKTLEQRVMTRVRRIYVMRKLFGPTAVKLYTMFGITAGLFSLVSVANVIANMPPLTAPTQSMTYLVRAALHTEPSVQLLIMAFILMMVLMMRDIMRSTREAVTPFAHI